MSKLNNKGFISTAAIYTIFVSFLMASILLLGVYSNNNNIDINNDVNLDFSNESIMPLDKTLPEMKEIISYMVPEGVEDVEENRIAYNSEVGAYKNEKDEYLDLIVKPIATTTHDIKKFIYSEDNGKTWIDWNGLNENGNPIGSQRYNENIEKTIIIKAVDYKDNISENFISIKLLVKRRNYCTSGGYNYSGFSWFPNGYGLTPGNLGLPCNKIDTTQSITITIYRYRYYHIGPDGACEYNSAGALVCHCACGDGCEAGPGTNWPEYCARPWYDSKWSITNSCYASIGNGFWNACSSGNNQMSSTRVTAYKWYSEG